MSFKSCLIRGCFLIASLFVMVSNSYAQEVKSCSAVFALGNSLEALRFYTTNPFHHINRKLREGRGSKLTPEELRLVNSLKADLESLPKYQGTAYRGIKVTSTVEEITAQYPIGKVISFKGFTSSSRDRNMAKIFGSLRGYPGYRTIIFEIESSNGRSIEAYVIDYLRGEKEVLFAPNEFQVLSVSQSSPTEVVISLREKN